MESIIRVTSSINCCYMPSPSLPTINEFEEHSSRKKEIDAKLIDYVSRNINPDTEPIAVCEYITKRIRGSHISSPSGKGSICVEDTYDTYNVLRAVDLAETLADRFKNNCSYLDINPRDLYTALDSMKPVEMSYDEFREHYNCNFQLIKNKLDKTEGFMVQFFKRSIAKNGKAQTLDDWYFLANEDCASFKLDGRYYFIAMSYH